MGVGAGSVGVDVGVMVTVGILGERAGVKVKVADGEIVVGLDSAHADKNREEKLTRPRSTVDQYLISITGCLAISMA